LPSDFEVISNYRYGDTAVILFSSSVARSSTTRGDTAALTPELQRQPPGPNGGQPT
jgi:hypothetical protein